VPGNGQCNVQVVSWNADDMEAKSAGGVRLSLNPGQTVAIDNSATESFKCGDQAETLAAIATPRAFERPPPEPSVTISHLDSKRALHQYDSVALETLLRS
jgi:hypothetical protein